MRIRNGLNGTLGVVILASMFVFVLPSDVQARGFCNVNHVGSKRFQEQISGASATFYNAGSALWQMLAQLENNKRFQAEKARLLAMEGFHNAAKAFTKAAEFTEPKVGKMVSAAYHEDVARLSLSSLRGKTAMNLMGMAKKGDWKGLLVECARGSANLGSETKKFGTILEKDDRQEGPFALLLFSWNRVLYLGRVVSAIFAVAGGEKP